MVTTKPIVFRSTRPNSQESNMPQTIIVVPCFNEEARMPMDSFRRFVRSNSRVRFLMVNDGSEDGTLNALLQLKSEFPTRFQVLNLLQNLGKAEAVRQGCCLAL